MDDGLNRFFSSLQMILEPQDTQALQHARTPLERCAIVEDLIEQCKLDDEWTIMCQSFLGNLYASGFDRKAHYEKARELLALVIDSGKLDGEMQALCQGNLAGLYAEGLGGAVLKKEARVLLRQAFDSGDLDEEMCSEYEPLKNLLDESSEK